MAIAFVVGDSASGNITVALNSSTADFAVIDAGSWPSAATTITEGGGFSNTWIPLTDANASSHHGRFFYAFLTSKGAGHTFQHNGTSPYICVGLFSGVPSTAILVDFVQTVTASPGTVAPTSNGSLIVSGIVHQTGTASTVSAGLTIIDAAIPGSGNVGGAMAYLIQGSAAAISPAWTGTIGGPTTACTAVFNAPTLPDVRQTQEVIELANPTAITTRQSQEIVELANPTIVTTRQSQEIVELLQIISAEVRQTQNVIEIMFTVPSLDGLYFINPEIAHDKYYTANKKIPNPTVRTGGIGQ